MSRKQSKSNTGNPPQSRAVTGMAWFDREQWQRLHEVAEDSDQLDETYAEWVFSANRAIAELEHMPRYFSERKAAR